MKKILFSLALSCLLCGGGIFALTACDKTPAEPKVYDMSGVTAEDVSVDYTGQAQTYAVKGQLPEGVEATYKYFSDEQRTTEVTNVVDAGTYYVTISFAGQEGYEAIADKQATLTVNKVKYSDVTVTVSAIEGEELGEEETYVTSTADENGDLYFQFKGDTNGFHLQTDPTYVTTSVDSTASDFTKTIQYFVYDTEIDGENEVVVEKSLNYDETYLTNLGQKIYVRVKVSDKNHLETEKVSLIYMTPMVVEISNKDDLLQVNKDLYEKDLVWRGNVKYVLTNDIDLEGELWHTISPLSPNIAVEGYSFCLTHYFCSEFDGNGKTISNFLLNENSIRYDLEYSEAGETKTAKIDGWVSMAAPYDQCMQLGFFGYVAGAHIHNLTIKDVNVDFNTNEVIWTTTSAEAGERGFSSLNGAGVYMTDSTPSTYGIGATLYYGTLVARGENDTSTFGSPIGRSASSSIHDITIDTVNAKLTAVKAYVGGVIGVDGNKDGFSRENIKTKDVSIQLYGMWNLNLASYGPAPHTVLSSNRHSMGGIVGETSGADNSVYTNCVVDGGKLEIRGYSSNPAFVVDNAFAYQVGGRRYEMIGGIIGWNQKSSSGVSLKNCTSSAEIDFYMAEANDDYEEKIANSTVMGYSKNYYQVLDNGLCGKGNSGVGQESVLGIEDSTFTGTINVYFLGVRQDDLSTPVA